MNKPSSSEYTSVVNFVRNEKVPLVKADAAFIWHKDDLVTLRPGREYAWLDSFIERFLRAFHCKLIEVRQDYSEFGSCLTIISGFSAHM